MVLFYNGNLLRYWDVSLWRGKWDWEACYVMTFVAGPITPPGHRMRYAGDILFCSCTLYQLYACVFVCKCIWVNIHSDIDWSSSRAAFKKSNMNVVPCQEVMEGQVQVIKQRNFSSGGWVSTEWEVKDSILCAESNWK